MFGTLDHSILQYINDYKLNLILPNEINDFSKFHSEFGKAMKYIAVSKNKEEYKKTTEDEYYGNISVETARLLNTCVGTTICINEKEEMISMCKAWDEQKASGIIKGEAKSLLEIVSNLQKNMSYSLESALMAIGKTLEDYENAKRVLEQE